MRPTYISGTAGEDILIEAVISDSAGALAISDLLAIYFELRSDTASAPILTKCLGAGISTLAASSSGVACLITLPQADTAALPKLRALPWVLVGTTSSQKSVAATGYLTINKPIIT